MKKIYLLILFVVVLCSCQSAVMTDCDLTDVVQTADGPLRGASEGDIHYYLGIPYAAPPVGNHRFRPPQAVAAWRAERNVTAFGPACPQPRQQAGGLYSEDCLYLNVWTPARKTGQRLPVMVWIHGGAFNFGSATQAEYHGKNLAQKGVVVVTLNYRLGPLGFMVHPLLSKESPEGVSGNYGLLDQMAALRWVQNNIASFGGNPDAVTIFGQSAGSRSVSLLMISPLASGLFSRAIAQSGGPILGSEYLNPNFNGSTANVSRMGQVLAERLGCSGAPDVLAALRAKTAQDIIVAADCSTSLFDDEALFFAPVFDGRVLPANPRRAYEDGFQHRVPMMVGSTANEGTLYLDGVTDLTLARYQSFLTVRFGSDTASTRQIFPAHQDRDVGSAIDRVVTVGANAQPARFIAQNMERKKVSSYLYHFTRRPDTALARRLGAHHGVELAFVFGNLSAAEGYNETDRSLSSAMMSYWVNFAKTGNPNGAGLPVWPVYQRLSDIHLEFGDIIRTGTGLYKTPCDFISERMQNYWR